MTPSPGAQGVGSQRCRGPRRPLPQAACPFPQTAGLLVNQVTLDGERMLRLCLMETSLTYANTSRVPARTADADQMGPARGGPSPAASSPAAP